MVTKRKPFDPLDEDKLLELIESKRWNETKEVVRVNPDCVRTIFESTGNLPLHEALKNNPPLDVVELLIEMDKTALRHKGQCGFLPLHFAVSCHASARVVAKLISAYPPSTRCRDDINQLLPLHLAAKEGASQDVVMEILTAHPEGIYLRDGNGKTAIQHAESLPRSPDNPLAEVREETIYALNHGPLLCRVSKAAQTRVAHENENKFRNLREAHTSQCKHWEERFLVEQTRTNRLEQSLKNDLDIVTNRAQSVSKQLLEKTDELEEISGRYEEIQATLSRDKKLHEEETVQLKEKMQLTIDTETQRGQVLSEHITDLKEQLDTVSTKLEEKLAAFNALATQHRELEAAHDQECKQSKERHLEMESVIATESKRGFDLSEQMNKKHEEVGSLSKQIQEKDEAIESLTVRHRELESTLVQERALHKARVEEYEKDMQTKLDTEINKGNMLEKKIKLKDEEVSALEAKIDVLEEEKRALEARLRKEQEANDVLADEIERIPLLEEVITKRSEQLEQTEALVTLHKQKCESVKSKLSRESEARVATEAIVQKLQTEIGGQDKQISDLQGDLGEALRRNKAYKARNESIQQWFKEKAGDMDRWTIDKVQKQVKQKFRVAARDTRPASPPLPPSPHRSHSVLQEGLTFGCMQPLKQCPPPPIIRDTEGNCSDENGTVVTEEENTVSSSFQSSPSSQYKQEEENLSEEDGVEIELEEMSHATTAVNESACSNSSMGAAEECKSAA